jgi:hypothetical protein
LGTRLPSACCGVLTVVLAFALAFHWRGLSYAAALAVLLDGSQVLVWLSQQNRFYSMALFFLTLTLAVIWLKAREWKAIAGCAIFASLGVLAHNLLVVVFGIGFVAACVAYPLGWVRRSVLIRSGVAALTGAAWYLAYLRPIMQGWVSGGTGGTAPLISFVAQAGMPAIALAVMGAGVWLLRRERDRALGWWLGLAAGGLVFVALSPRILSAWNARYAILFLPPLWVLAAYGMEAVARRLPSGREVLLWYGCVALLLLPKLASHYVDGSRHDFRQAGELIVRHTPLDCAVYCNLPEALEYYLTREQPRTVHRWDRGTELPTAGCVVAYVSNVWEPPLQVPGRSITLLDDVRARRFDEQSHSVRIYLIAERPAP